MDKQTIAPITRYVTRTRHHNVNGHDLRFSIWLQQWVVDQQQSFDRKADAIRAAASADAERSN